MSFSQIYSKEYEDYLITGDESSLDSLINGSIEKDYFLLIKKLLNEKYSQELQKEIDDFMKRIKTEQSYRLQSLILFRQINDCPEKKGEISEKIKNLFNIKNALFNSKIINDINTSNSNIFKDDDESSLKTGLWIFVDNDYPKLYFEE